MQLAEAIANPSGLVLSTDWSILGREVTRTVAHSVSSDVMLEVSAKQSRSINYGLHLSQACLGIIYPDLTMTLALERGRLSKYDFSDDGYVLYFADVYRSHVEEQLEATVPPEGLVVIGDSK